jgi:hypothetical protein
LFSLKEKRIMDLTPFTTTELTPRHDGWSAERKLRFLDRLAACGNVRTACARVGLSREAAYRLRRRDALFARGWDAALMLARPRGADVLADKATEGIEEEVWYRGEMVGTRRRFDARLLLAHIARLDRMAQELPPESAEDAARFDELLACIGGAQVPRHLEVDDNPLPLDRDTAILMADEMARDAARELQEERRQAEGKKNRRLSNEERSAAECEIAEASARACEEAGAQWDAWFTGACEAVDRLLSGTAQAPERETSPGDADEAGATDDTGTETPQPSTVSTCQLHPLGPGEMDPGSSPGQALKQVQGDVERRVIPTIGFASATGPIVSSNTTGDR